MSGLDDEDDGPPIRMFIPGLRTDNLKVEAEDEKKTKVSKPGQERVSKKIAKLIGDEGKSKEQAAAIAYSMEERGELK